MILTRQKHLPWLSVILITATGGAAAFVEMVSNNALTFTLRKFTSDPALIAFLGSINIAFNFLVAPYASWKSDRIWTRWGRRKPFMLIGLAILVPALIAAPLATSIWTLTFIVIIYQFALDLGYTGPWAPLLYEVVPLHQRGRMVIIKNLISSLAGITFSWWLIGQFDKVYHLRLGSAEMTITGEQVIYSLGAALVLLVLLHLAFNVREVKPDVLPPAERFSVKAYLKDVFSDRQFVLIYLLLFCLVALWAGLGQLAPLLITEQFGYSKAMLGKIQTFTIILNLCVVLPVAGLIADRVDRFRAFQIGLFLSTLHPLGYWLFVKYMAANQLPTPMQITIASMLGSFLHSLASLCLEPYFFDLVPRNKMGAANSGFLFVRGILTLVVANGVGLWVKYFSQWFGSSGQIDYMSGYLYIFLVGSAGSVVSVYFSIQRRKGRVIEYGRIEEQAAPAPALVSKAEPVASRDSAD